MPLLTDDFKRKRKRRIEALLSKGKSYRGIGRQIGLSEARVRQIVKNQNGLSTFRSTERQQTFERLDALLEAGDIDAAMSLDRLAALSNSTLKQVKNWRHDFRFIIKRISP